jgi:hypothetical protein
MLFGRFASVEAPENENMLSSETGQEIHLFIVNFSTSSIQHRHFISKSTHKTISIKIKNTLSGKGVKKIDDVAN